jgi:hypothetical protein
MFAGCSSQGKEQDRPVAGGNIGDSSQQRGSYSEYGYDSLIAFGFGHYGTLPPQFRNCHAKAVDTLVFADAGASLTFELRADSLTGFSQDSMEGNAGAPMALRRFSYDSIPRVFEFAMASAPRTLIEFQLSPSCDSLVGIMIWKTAYHPQDESSGVGSNSIRFRRVK